MTRENAIKHLHSISDFIERNFNTIVLRRSIIGKEHPLYSSMQPQSTSHLTGRENNLLQGEESEKVKLQDDPNINYLGVIMVPVSSDNYILSGVDESSDKSTHDILSALSEEMGITTYGGGNMVMSYPMDRGMDEPEFYGTADKLLSPDIYSAMGSVKYFRIIFFV